MKFILSRGSKGEKNGNFSNDQGNMHPNPTPAPFFSWQVLSTYSVRQFQHPFLRQFLGSFDQNQVRFLLEI